MFDFLKEYPQVGTLIIGLFFTSIGYFGKTIIDILLEKRKREAGLQELFWKEKIQAAKKASEYYYMHLSFLQINAEKIETYINGKEYSEVLNESFEEVIEKLQKKIVEPSNFEHHHINLFYSFDESKIHDLNKERFEILQELESVKFSPDDDKIIWMRKRDAINTNYLKLINNYKKLYKIYDKNMNIVKGDITDFIK